MICQQTADALKGKGYLKVVSEVRIVKLCSFFYRVMFGDGAYTARQLIGSDTLPVQRAPALSLIPRARCGTYVRGAMLPTVAG